MMKQGGKDFFCQIYDNTYRKASLLVTSKCGNLDDISDILQETYAEVYAAIQQKGISYIKEPEGFVLDIARKKSGNITKERNRSRFRILTRKIPVRLYVREGNRAHIRWMKRSSIVRLCGRSGRLWTASQKRHAAFFICFIFMIRPSQRYPRPCLFHSLS